MEATGIPLKTPLTLTVTSAKGSLTFQGRLHARGGKALDLRLRAGHGASRLVHRDDIVAWTTGYNA